MNKEKYAIISGDEIVGIVWESDTYGRTIVLDKKIDLNCDIEIIEFFKDKNSVVEGDIKDYIWSLLPKY